MFRCIFDAWENFVVIYIYIFFHSLVLIYSILARTWGGTSVYGNRTLPMCMRVRGMHQLHSTPLAISPWFNDKKATKQYYEIGNIQKSSSEDLSSFRCKYICQYVWLLGRAFTLLFHVRFSVLVELILGHVIFWAGIALMDRVGALTHMYPALCTDWCVEIIFLYVTDH